MSNGKFSWRAGRIAQRTRLLRVISDDEYATIFDAKFVEGLEKKREQSASRSQKVQVAQATIFLLLALALLSVNLKVSFFSLSTDDVKNLREILLVAAASVTFMNIIKVIEEAEVRDLLRLFVSKLSGKNADIRRALDIRYGLSSRLSFFSIEDARQLRKRDWLVLLAGLLGLAIPVTMAIVAMLLIQIWAMIDIWVSPTISRTMSFWVIVYVIAVDLAALALPVMTAMADLPEGLEPEKV